MHLLVIEDEPVIGKFLKKGFTEAGHECNWVKNGEQGLALALEQPYDAIVLDLMLPGHSGSEILQEIRAKGISTPVIVLTALGSVENRVENLNLGADDYLVKPFDFAELMARIEAVRRRSYRPAPVLQVGDVALDLTNRTVRRGDVKIDLTPTEFSVLEMLLRHAGQVVTRKMLCQHLWESDWEGTTNVIEVHINRLRGKLEKGFSGSVIHTVRGRGYVFRAD